MAVTARDNRDRGRPSAWSAALDSLAADTEEQGETPRLIIVSAGNIADLNAWAEYPDSNDTDGVHDPAQAWNALTIGAFTELVEITEADTEDYEPVAPEGGLSPFSTTSLTWEERWPLKPDVVLEGGNAAKDSLSAVYLPSLSLLTTHHRPFDRLFTVANATSAATALASRLAAQVMAVYPQLWPETVRALIVHSARMDRRNEARIPASGQKPIQVRLPKTVATVRVRRARTRPRTLERCELPDYDRSRTPASLQARDWQATFEPRHAPP